jgi:hypothetical protein
MIIFPKKDIVPIIVPQIVFKDKYNDFNSYTEMNPSMYIDENCDTIILVRCINYKKFSLKEYTLYEQNSNSIYCILRGKISEQNKLDLEAFEYKIIQNNYNLPLFPTYWKGVEDIRFIDKNTILANVPELNENGLPSIYRADLNDNIITNFMSCKPNDKIEKNWMPYKDTNESNNQYNNQCNKVIYSVNPFIIKSIDTNDFEEIELPQIIQESLTGYHGSTNGIELNNYERLFLIHINKEKTIHRWLLFHTRSKNVIISEEFVFFKNSYIEFNCSLCKYDERIFITIGVNDNRAYIIETTNDDIISTFKINDNEEKYPTIVTMLYDIRSMESNQIERNRKIESYIDFSKQFLLKLPFPIVFFIDENEEAYDAIYNFRKDIGLLSKTCIYMQDFKKTYFYKDLSRLEELQKIFFIRNGELEHETPLYIILNNNKFDCIDKTIKLNPFNSSHLIWMDFGINHVAQSTEYIYEWIDKVPDKIKQLCINPYIENIEPKIYFQNIYHNMAGGLFSGSIENLTKYSELFKNKTAQIYEENWYQIDEAVMTIVQRENPDLFELFYGDYQGIVSNYISPIHNIELIINGVQKCIDSNKTKEAFHILCYCAPYFVKNYNHHSTCLFIQQNIIVDYYHNNKELLKDVIDIINLYKSSDDEIANLRIQSLLENNIENIKYYDILL